MTSSWALQSKDLFLFLLTVRRCRPVRNMNKATLYSYPLTAIITNDDVSLNKVACPFIHPSQTVRKGVPISVQECTQRLSCVPSAPILIVQDVENLRRRGDTDEPNNSAECETLCDAGLMAGVWDDNCK